MIHMYHLLMKTENMIRTGRTQAEIDEKIVFDQLDGRQNESAFIESSAIFISAVSLIANHYQELSNVVAFIVIGVIILTLLRRILYWVGYERLKKIMSYIYRHFREVPLKSKILLAGIITLLTGICLMPIIITAIRSIMNLYLNSMEFRSE